MKATYLLSFFLFAACNIASDSAQNSSSEHHQFRLVLTWPPGYCKFKTCRANISRSFVIHGLWSVNEKGETLNDCSGKNFNINKMLRTGSESLKKDMNKYWSSITLKSSEVFWSRQWLKHGRCAEDVLNARSYFKKAVSLMKKSQVNYQLPTKYLQANGSSYPTGDYRFIMEYKIGSPSVIINCKWEPHTVPHLTEISICADAQADDFVECNVKDGYCIKKRIAFAR